MKGEDESMVSFLCISAASLFLALKAVCSTFNSPGKEDEKEKEEGEKGVRERQQQQRWM